MAALVGFSFQAEAQEKKPVLEARAVAKAKDGESEAKGKMRRIEIVASTRAGHYTYQKDVDNTADVAIDKHFSSFYVLMPPDLVEAQKLYAAESFAEARPKLAESRKKWENWKGLPEGPYLKAFRMEVECAIRMMDFAGAASIAKSFPDDMKKLLTPQDKVLCNTAVILGAAAKNDPAKLEEAVNRVLKGEDKKAVTPQLYGWLQFAVAMAYENAVPAEERAANNISEANAVAASKAIDCYCRTGMSSHGAQMELPIEGMKRAQKLLWAMPGVQKEVKDFGHPTPDKFKKASQNFQDAVILAYMLINVYGVEAGKTSDLAKAAALFQNTKSKKK